MKLEDILDKDDALTSWKLEVARLQRELREAHEATAKERARADAATKENQQLRGLIAKTVHEAMQALKPGDVQ